MGDSIKSKNGSEKRIRKELIVRERIIEVKNSHTTLLWETAYVPSGNMWEAFLGRENLN